MTTEEIEEKQIKEDQRKALRDKFAMAVLPAAASGYRDTRGHAGSIAETAYIIADAMLKEREK